MKEQLIKAKQILESENYTCVITDGIELHTSKKRGVTPLLELYDNQRSVKGFVSADKVIGKAAAFLYVLLEVSAVYAGVISRTALKVLKENGIYVQYEKLVDGIKNRENTGPCPMEKATSSCSRADEAIKVIRETLIKLRGERV